MSTVAKNEKSMSGDSPVCTKSRGNRLARRARSFKEDFLEIISQMRSPGGSGTRSGSPSSPKHQGKKTDLADGPIEKTPSKDLECNIRQAQLALKHFRGVINKNKLEMLPGNGTVVLETVTAIHVLLKKYVLNEQSSTLVSATNQVYQSVAKLIRVCDDYLLIGEKALGKENVAEIVNLVEYAIQNLVSLTKDKLILKDCKAGNDVSGNQMRHKPRTFSEKNNLEFGQRSSLPDIPLTPREREILEKNSAFVLERHSQSTENVLSDSPPPKPPHPDRVNINSSFPPPLPPKKKHRVVDDLMTIKNSVECLSLQSKSPEDSSSLLSASAGSLDSVLNHCREEESFSILPSEGCQLHVYDSSYEPNDSPQHLSWGYSSSDQVPVGSPVLNFIQNSSVYVPDINPLENTVLKLDRLSGSQAESGFSSMPSRSSSQSYSASSQQLSSTRSSQQSYTSQETHHTEKKVISTTESNTSKKFHSVTVETNDNQVSTQKTVSTSSLSEKLTYQKQTFTKCTKKSTEVIVASDDSSCKKIENIPCCHHEVKVRECPYHASHLSSSPEFFNYNKYTYDHGHSSASPEDDKPPALPEKIRSRSKKERHPSQYDNLDETNFILENNQEKNFVFSQTVIQDSAEVHKQRTVNISQMDCIDGTTVESKNGVQTSEHFVQNIGSTVFQSTQVESADGTPPPLPPKKKHIMAYMEIFGNASHANANEFLRHSVHAHNVFQSEWQQHQRLLTSTHSCSLNFNYESNQSTPIQTSQLKSELKTSLPPALPPKKKTRSSTSSPPQTPTLLSDADTSRSEFLENTREATQTNSLPDETPSTPLVEKKVVTAEPLSGDTVKDEEVSLLDKLNVSDYLVVKKQDDEGPDIRGGHPDALIIHATKAHRNDFLYQEAFLTTYRTFLTPLELIQKLCYRHEKFSSSQDSLKQRSARESFSLLVRVVSDLTLTDLDQVVLQTLMEFVQQLLCRGDLTMAKALRVIMLNKYQAKKLYLSSNTLLPTHNISTRQSLLLDFKSEHIAEQMTLLDADLFLKIEIPEVLIWAQEQNEERSPNLTKFTEHFNKMSYWARSRILEQNDAKDREKYVIKFIKIMKHLRKINNFNSYLALLSALDSAPIRRLEWQKHITEGLKEYCALIDSSSSFRAYRQALADTNPPCIPYIGLVLQDLTFVHIGNSNDLPSGGINFSKRWQQFNIVENMKRFKKGCYSYKKNEKILAFFNGFDDSLSEEAMWQISEKIKPRGGKKT